MTDDVRDRVGLAGAGRTLDDHALGVIQLLDDADLRVIALLGEEQVIAGLSCWTSALYPASEAEEKLVGATGFEPATSASRIGTGRLS